MRSFGTGAYLVAVRDFTPSTVLIRGRRTQAADSQSAQHLSLFSASSRDILTASNCHSRDKTWPDGKEGLCKKLYASSNFSLLLRVTNVNFLHTRWILDWQWSVCGKPSFPTFRVLSSGLSKIRTNRQNGFGPCLKYTCPDVEKNECYLLCLYDIHSENWGSYL